MASSDGYFARPSNRYLHLSGDGRRDHSLSLSSMDSDSVFEFDESDIYNSVRANNSVHSHRSLGNKVNYKSSSATGGRAGGPASVPVNIPDWSKILGEEYRDKQQRWRRNISNNMEEYEEEEGNWDCCVAPHEYLARTRVASSSVHEGIGRTLKGRDLSRVRNAIWAKTGFSD